MGVNVADKMRSCTSKVFCASEGSARSYLGRLIRAGRKRRANARYELVPYRCRYCQGWHVGNVRRDGE